MTEQSDSPRPHGPEQAPDTPTKNATKNPAESAPASAAERATETTTETTTEAPPSRGTRTTPRPRTRPRAGSARAVWRRFRDALATVIVIAAAAAAIILAVHVVFVVFEANGANGIVKTINSWADSLAWNFKDIFTPTNPKTAALVNYGLAAVIYLIVGRVLAAVIRRAG
jgi:uncharacterized membrane protein